MQESATSINSTGQPTSKADGSRLWNAKRLACTQSLFGSSTAGYVCRCACVPYLWIISSVSERMTSLLSADAKTLSMELTTKRMEAVSFARESNAHRLPPACATVERVCVRSRLESE